MSHTASNVAKAQRSALGSVPLVAANDEIAAELAELRRQARLFRPAVLRLASALIDSSTPPSPSEE